MKLKDAVDFVALHDPQAIQLHYYNNRYCLCLWCRMGAELDAMFREIMRAEVVKIYNAGWTTDTACDPPPTASK